MNSLFARNQLERAGSHRSPNLSLLPAAVVVAEGFASLKVVVDWARREVCHQGGRRCKLSTREAALLACLARKAGTPVSRDEILLQVWQLDPRRTTTRTIDMHVSLLRRKLEDDADRPGILITVHSVGYMLLRGAIAREEVPPATRSTGRVSWKLIADIETL